MEFTFGDAYKDGPLALGLHQKGSFYDILTVDGCEIIGADWSRILTATLAFSQAKCAVLSPDAPRGNPAESGCAPVAGKWAVPD